MPPKAKKAPKAPKVKVGGKILAAFQSLDTNGDGTITKDELSAVLKILDKGLWTDRKINALMKVLDQDSNGKIDYDDFTRWIMAGPETERDRASVMALGEAPQKTAAQDPKEPKKEAAAEESDEQDMHEVLERIFVFYDEDQDGQIERIELLDGEERRRGKGDFGPKQRKAIITWFKEAGAEGTPTDGMYLSKEKWRAAMVKLAAEESGIGEPVQPGRLAAWLREYWLAPLEPSAAASTATPAVPSGQGSVAAVPAAAPVYPLTVSFNQLKDAMSDAAALPKAVLVLASGVDQVETFMKYQMTALVDCKQIISETLIKKSTSKADAQAEVRTKLAQAMNSSGFCKPLYIRLSNSAFDWKSFCCEDVPAEMFDPKVWTIENAFNRGFFDSGHKFALEIEDQKKWKDFYVVMTSTFNLEQANEHLADKIPGYESLAIIVVDPTSVA